jgi:uncharacterized protein
MKIKKWSDGSYIVRIDKGEEIVEKMKEFCLSEKIKTGWVSGIGAVRDITLGFFDPNTKQYSENIFEDSYEVSNLNGNITWKDDSPYIHLHITIADKDGRAYGGHLTRATVSGACEIVVGEASGVVVGRVFDEEVGLNLMDL